EDIKKLNFEESIKQLKEIVERIEQGQIPLQDSLEQYEEGMALINHCRGILQKAEKRIEKISKEQEPAEQAADDESPVGDEPESDDGGLF
ncbi:MAG: exodeoxyribonuclease VII small subunit, partial [Sedimentisphaerales bacterium]|nr:exodeoxyribonuclease VII small subunit [Sedimentisphaerales bacterium]